MQTITISITKATVLDEVAKTTDYTGSKLIGTDASARDRIFATDDDLETLDRFWDDAVVGLEERFREVFNSADTTDGTYNFKCERSDKYNSSLNNSVTDAVMSYFVAYIVGRWFNFVNKEGVADYLTLADDGLATAERLLYNRKRPSRPQSGTPRPLPNPEPEAKPEEKEES